MEKTGYTEDFYLELTEEGVIYSAEKTLSVILSKLPPVNSAVDVGCGLGTWLIVLLKLRNQKVEILGIDGPWINRDLLVIPKDNFFAIDFSLETPRINGRYDLAISLEVAEHLPPEKAEEFTSFLTEISDFVLFSAAIPFQGGTNHFNERWQGYWADLFKQKGYLPVDLIRPVLWNDRKVSVHYKQNLILYAKKERVEEIKLPSILDGQMLSLSHPECYTKHARPGVKRAFRVFRESIRRSLARKLSGNKKKRDLN